MRRTCSPDAPDVRDATGPARYNLGMTTNTTTHLIIGAGPTGLSVARLLADEGHRVTLVSRRAVAPPHPAITHVSADASDPAQLIPLAAGATTVFNCAMPRYDRWPEEFPPIGRAVLQAVKQSGARLVTLSNVYGYGLVDGPMRETLPLAPTTVKGRVRTQMWLDALASGARVTEVRASDYLGPGAASIFTLMTLPSLLRGEEALYPGDLDLPHSWTFTGDVAKTLVAASRSDASWGRAWHVPSTDVSTRDLAARIATLAGQPSHRLTRLPLAGLQALAQADTLLREVIEMTYLFDRPWRLDWAETQRALGVHPTPFDEVLAETLRHSNA